MAGVNKVTLIGNLGKDPEVRHLENGNAVANFSLATSEVYKNKQGEKVTATEWHNIVLWTPLAELAEKFLKKGRQVYIEGKITNRTYQDKENVTRYVTEIVGREMTFLGGAPNAGDASQNVASQVATESATTQQIETKSEDDLPF